MSGSIHHVDYINTAFEYPILDKIHGAPTFSTLNRLKKQLQANAQSVSSDLGGGAHGHLGLVLTPTEYATVSDIAYTMPAHPGSLTIPRNTDAVEAVRRRDAHQERIRKFREATDVQKALIRQIVASIDGHYIDELRNATTNTITKTIPEILQHLFDNFSDVTSHDIQQAEDKIRQYFWNIAEPPMSFYHLIEELQTLATAAKIPRTETQMINYGIDILQKTGDMEKGLLDWFEKPANQHTWQNFKLHFTQAHRALRKIRGKTIKNTPFHQANSIIHELNNNISTLRDEFRESISLITPQPPPSPYIPPQSPSPSPTSSLTPTANSVTTQDLLQIISQLQSQLNQQQNPSQYKKPKSSFIRNQTDHYCWTHGACGHDSKDCRNKKPGHEDSATFENKLGGSTFFCKTKNDKPL